MNKSKVIECESESYLNFHLNGVSNVANELDLP